MINWKNVPLPLSHAHQASQLREHSKGWISAPTHALLPVTPCVGHSLPIHMQQCRSCHPDSGCGLEEEDASTQTEM